MHRDFADFYRDFLTALGIVDRHDVVQHRKYLTVQTKPAEDRATATGSMPPKLGHVVREIREHTDRQTGRQTDRRFVAVHRTYQWPVNQRRIVLPFSSHYIRFFSFFSVLHFLVIGSVR